MAVATITIRHPINGVPPTIPPFVAAYGTSENGVLRVSGIMVDRGTGAIISGTPELHPEDANDGKEWIINFTGLAANTHYDLYVVGTPVEASDGQLDIVVEP